METTEEEKQLWILSTAIYGGMVEQHLFYGTQTDTESELEELFMEQDFAMRKEYLEDYRNSDEFRPEDIDRVAQDFEADGLVGFVDKKSTEQVRKELPMLGASIKLPDWFFNELETRKKREHESGEDLLFRKVKELLDIAMFPKKPIAEMIPGNLLSDLSKLHAEWHARRFNQKNLTDAQAWEATEAHTSQEIIDYFGQI